VQPLNYSIDVLSPFQTAVQGYGIGATIRDDQQAQQDRQLKLEAARRQQESAAAMQAELAEVARNPTPQKITALVIKNPQLSEHFNRAAGMLTEQQRTGAVRSLGPAYAAALNKRPDIAQRLLEERAVALENSGLTEDAREARDMARLVEMDAGNASVLLGGFLASAMGADKFAENYGKLGAEQRAADKAPAELKEAEAKATTAAVTAKFAESQAIADLEKKGWDIKALQADIDFKRESTRIAAMNAAAAREGNALKRQELQLKIDEAVAARETKVREKVAVAEAGASSIDNMLNTVERIKGNKSLNDVVGSLEGQPFYPNASLGTANPFGDGDERADAIRLIETLGSQAFLAQIPNIKGMGALSNAEGDKLQSALQNLSRVQSEKQFRANLDEASRLLKKGREQLSRSTGVPLGKPDTPAAPGSRPPLSSFESREGGATESY
jgi:hypothetical protein